MTRKKLLIVNLQTPKESKYRSPKDIGVWMWGRRMSNYAMFAVSDDGSISRIIPDCAEITTIQNAVDTALL